MKKPRTLEPEEPELPNEIWIKIIETGISNSILNHKDVISFSLSSKYFHELSNEDSVWSTFLTLKYPDQNQIQDQNQDQDHSSPSDSKSSSSSCCKKTLYRCRYKLAIDSERRTLYFIRRKLIAMTRKLNRHRRDIIAKKIAMQAEKELTAAEEQRYNHLFNTLDSMEKYMNDMKKDVYPKHAYYKKRYGEFREEESSNSSDFFGESNQPAG